MKTEIDQKQVWIAGAAKSGLAAAQLLKKHGAIVFVSDAGPISAEGKETLNRLNIPFEEGVHSIDRMLIEAELIVLSPSIALDRPLPAAALNSGIPVVSEIECASWFLPPEATVIGITGTNGKSTTTHYLAQLMKRAGRKAIACGNYGTPLSDALLSENEYDCFVVELSSYQLETTYSLRPDVSVFLNLQNDHQARYGNLGEYFKAKWRLVLLTKASGTNIVDAPVFQQAIKYGCALPESRVVLSYGFLDDSQSKDLTSYPIERTSILNPQQSQLARFLPRPSYGHMTERSIVRNLETEVTHAWLESPVSGNLPLTAILLNSIERKDALQMCIQRPVLEGPHNQVNVFSASIAALSLGAQESTVISQWESENSNYVHLAHRLEEISKGSQFVTSTGQPISVRIINDSKATNVESAVVAVKSFPSGIRLLLGGEPKGDSYTPFLSYLGNQIKKIYPFGKAAQVIVEQISPHSLLAQSSARMLDAAQLALEESQDGDIILLSPACASFDEFQNFEHRGDMFRQWAEKQVSSK
ncbi:MAG: hypothetical protein RJB13_1033 [Pseudomonadota bacterium]